ncbi:MAG: hypothetical protein KAI44_05850 [Methylococcales bacterium]|nr:hypothetical protein [Methylococcales bacterium]
MAVVDVVFAIGAGVIIKVADLIPAQGDISKVTETIKLSTDTINNIKQKNFFFDF